MVEATSMPIIQKAVKVIYDMSEDSKTRELARMREKALHDEASALSDAREDGIAIGEERKLAEIVEKMRAMGMPEEQIKAITS